MHHPVDESNDHSLVNEPTQSPPTPVQVLGDFPASSYTMPKVTRSPSPSWHRNSPEWGRGSSPIHPLVNTVQGPRAGPLLLEGTRAVPLPGTWPAHPLRKFTPCAARVEVISIHLAMVLDTVRSCFVPVLAKERQHALFNAHPNHRTKPGIGSLLGTIGLLPHRRTRYPRDDRWPQSCTDTAHTSGSLSRSRLLIIFTKCTNMTSNNWRFALYFRHSNSCQKVEPWPNTMPSKNAPVTPMPPPCCSGVRMASVPIG